MYYIHCVRTYSVLIKFYNTVCLHLIEKYPDLIHYTIITRSLAHCDSSIHTLYVYLSLSPKITAAIFGITKHIVVTAHRLMEKKIRNTFLKMEL